MQVIEAAITTGSMRDVHFHSITETQFFYLLMLLAVEDSDEVCCRFRIPKTPRKKKAWYAVDAACEFRSLLAGHLKGAAWLLRLLSTSLARSSWALMASYRPVSGARTFEPGRLYFVSFDGRAPRDDEKNHFFTIDETLKYWNFYLDFGASIERGEGRILSRSPLHAALVSRQDPPPPPPLRHAPPPLPHRYIVRT